MNPNEPNINRQSTPPPSSLSSSSHEHTSPNSPFRHTTRYILSQVNNAVVAESCDLSPLDSETKRKWINNIILVRSNITTEPQAHWIVRSLTLWIYQLLAERLSQEVLTAVSAAVHVRDQDNNIIDIAKLMLLTFERMLDHPTTVTESTRQLLEQLSSHFVSPGSTIREVSSSTTAFYEDDEDDGDFTGLGWTNHPADTDAIRYLDDPHHTWTIEHDHDPEDLCSICQQCLVAGETATKTPCGHLFHRDCLRSWLLGFDGVCPNCRSAVLGVKHTVLE